MMNANDLVQKMKALRPDSMDVLDLIDEMDNCTMRVWREYIDNDSHDSYYRIRISGFGDTVCELLPDRVTATVSGIQLYTVVGGNDDTRMTCGYINTTNWEVRGE